MRLCMSKYTCCLTCVHACAHISEPECGWARLYESRQCARGEQGSEKDAAAVGGGRQRQAEGPPSRRQFD